MMGWLPATDFSRSLGTSARRGLLSLLWVTSLSAGCVIFDVKGGDYQAALDENRSLWNSTGITNYTMRFQRTSSCVLCDTSVLVPVRITVRGDTIIEVVDLDANAPLQFFSTDDFLTINRLFEFIQGSIDQQAVEIDVSYDGTLGYPTDIDIDVSRRFFDDQTGFLIREFVEN